MDVIMDRSIELVTVVKATYSPIQRSFIERRAMLCAVLSEDLRANGRQAGNTLCNALSTWAELGRLL